ncbi:uncharacterized protein LOC143895704 [Temnothorax americanus]|uniref:uncharacterized protein LOC143895704 n=1 Tax=Temnothorax americanus TaxID=1964332 RepID=UPI00406888B5
MHYLKTSLSGEALKFVTNLPMSGDSFEIAWDTLVTRYENKRFLISAYLDSLTNLKPLKTKAASGLSSLLASATESIGALRALGCFVDYWDPILVHLLVKLLDADSREAWEVKLGSTSTFPTFKQFEDFVIGRTQAMQNLVLEYPNAVSSKEHSNRHSSSTRFGNAVHVGSSDSNTNYPCCPLCDASHNLSGCPTFQSKTSNQRYDIVAQKRRCFNCLGGHALRNCRSIRRCLKCGKQHHTSIHPGKGSQVQGGKAVALSQINEKEPESTIEDSSTSNAE